MSENKTDKLVMDLLAKVEQKKKQIGNAERPSWVTNCSFGFDPNNTNARLNIQTVRDISQLVEIHAFIAAKEASYEQSLIVLNISEKDAPFKWQGFTAEQWYSDITTRLNGLQIKAKKDELLALEERVNALVSPEQRRQIELEKLTKELA